MCKGRSWYQADVEHAVRRREAPRPVGNGRLLGAERRRWKRAVASRRELTWALRSARRAITFDVGGFSGATRGSHPGPQLRTDWMPLPGRSRNTHGQEKTPLPARASQPSRPLLPVVVAGLLPPEIPSISGLETSRARFLTFSRPSVLSFARSTDRTFRPIQPTIHHHPASSHLSSFVCHPTSKRKTKKRGS